MKNFFFYALSVVIGLACAFYLVRYLRHEHFASNELCMMAFAVTVVLFTVAGHVFTVKFSEEPVLPEVSEVPPIENKILADGNWGWLMPEEGRLKSGYPLKKERVIIGRDVKCDIMINDESVSRQHAEIMKTEFGYKLTDMNSKNGIFVNNQRISQAYLQDSDLVIIGNRNFTIKILQPIYPPEPEILQSDFATARLDPGDKTNLPIDDTDVGM